MAAGHEPLTGAADILKAMAPAAMTALFGPTGIGKTAVAVALAERLRADGAEPVAISADALQLYAGLEVLTGAPTADERRRLEHRLVGILPLTASSSAGEYARRAHEEIDAVLAAGGHPIVVGGTGLYLRAALAELDLRPPTPPERRAHWNRELERLGPRALHELLAARHPEAAVTVGATDAQRIVRSLELLDAGTSPVIARGEQSRLWTRDTRHPTLLAGIVMDRAELYARIDARVDAMVAAGAADEVRAAVAAGVSATARKALGFDELIAGDVAAMKQNTRRFAKRQLTWMRKLPGVLLVDATGRPPEAVADELHAALAAPGAHPAAAGAARAP